MSCRYLFRPNKQIRIQNFRGSFHTASVVATVEIKSDFFAYYVAILSLDKLHPIHLKNKGKILGTSQNFFRLYPEQKCLIAQAYKPRQYLSLSYQLRSHCYDSGLISLSRQNIEETVMVKRRISLPHFLL